MFSLSETMRYVPVIITISHATKNTRRPTSYVVSSRQGPAKLTASWVLLENFLAEQLITVVTLVFAEKKKRFSRVMSNYV